jgi:chemosensory pili system protein ChpE
MTSLFISAIGLGIAFSAPPGAVTAESLRRGMICGFWAVLFVQFGSLIGDAFWAIAALVGTAFLVQNVPAQLVLGMVGTILLLRLAWGALRDAHSGAMPGENEYTSSKGHFMTGALISLANPWAVAFWLGLGGAVTALKGNNAQADTLVIFFCGFMTGAVFWCFFVSGLIAWGRGFITPRFFRLINLVCGIGLGYFGLSLLWKLVQLI